MNYQKVKYKATNNDIPLRKGYNPLWFEYDPREWENSNRTYKREKTFGIFTELSKNLIFTKDAASFFRTAYELKDIEANVTLDEYRFHPNTEEMYLHSAGYLNFKDYSSTKLGVKLPFKSGGLNALIKSQIKEKFEIERLEAINGNVINEINKKLVALTSRNIFLVTTWKSDNANKELGENGNKNTFTTIESNDGNTRGAVTALPLNIIGQSHEGLAQFIIPSELGDNGSLGDYVGTASNTFFLNSDQQRTFRLEFDYDFDIWFQQYERVGWCFYTLNLVKYENGTDLNVKDRVFLHEIKTSNIASNGAITTEDSLLGDFFGATNFVRSMKGSYSTTVTVEEGESLSFEIWLRSDLEVSNTAGIRAYVQDVKCSLQIEEDSYFDDSQTEAVLMHDIGDKLMQIITGEQGRFRSEFYKREELNETGNYNYIGDGEFSRVGLTLGFWIRQFYYLKETIEDVETIKYGMEISLDNFLTTSNAVFNTGYHIEVIDGVETLVLEDLKYYFQDATAIELPYEVTDYEEFAESDYCHSSLEFGYKKGGEYEEAMGLDEYNVKTGFTTPLERVDTKYSKLSDARSDPYAKEFARRKQKENYATTDTPYDKDLHLLDLKEGLGNALEERNYSDDFEELPKGVFSPETATNLRLTPSQIEQRHEWFYGAGLLREQSEVIRYSNTGGNNSLSTKKAGEAARGERDNINVSNLQKARFQPKKVKFKHAVDYFINQQLNGKTNVGGRLIPNVYFKIKYKYQGQFQYGYLLQVQPDKEGNWELLKAI